MRDSFNYDMLPIVQDNISLMGGIQTLTNISSNGYYGFQPAAFGAEKEHNQQHEEMNAFANCNNTSEPCEIRMDVQFEQHQQQNQIANRKRCWDYNNDFREFKKRRENECIPFTYQPPPTSTTSSTPNRNVAVAAVDVKLRKPTHNIPDMPRCIMGHYI